MTTNRNRWKVKKSKWLANPPVGASPIYTGSWHVESNDGEYAAFATHAEALAYADRMARTVEVTLPRIGDQFIHKQRATPSYDDITITKANLNNYQIRYAEDMGADGRRIDMLADELKPVALALLALHYRNQP